MAEIIPSPLTLDETEYIRRLRLVAPHVKTIHIDVMDGEFVPKNTWADPKKIAALHLPVDLEVHLMVHNPSEHVPAWMKAGAERVIMHVEARGFAGGPHVAINPPTPITAIPDSTQTVLVMGVTPGSAGQKFQPAALKKIKELKRSRPNLRVEVDGGVSAENAQELVEAGADVLIATNAIFNTPDPLSSLKELQRLCHPSTTQK